MMLQTQPDISALHKVVVIDDSPIIQRMVYFALRNHGCKTFMFGDVTDALNVIRQEHPELIILDINFPPDGALGAGRDGFWAIEWLHRVEEIKTIPVIMISSEDPATARPHALAAGAAAFLQKPIHMGELIALSLDLISRNSASPAALPAQKS